LRAGHPSIKRNASTNRENRCVNRQHISSGADFERRVGYSRAVRVGSQVWVSGTAPIMPDDADPPAGAYDQAQVCLSIIARALEQAGSSLDQVVRTRIYVADPALIDEVGRAHAEAFVRARPATTGIVAQLLDPRWLVEIEAEAVILTT
jgi:enamine deaminase RidA (YjgF/YER057c/UK114 family)